MEEAGAGLDGVVKVVVCLPSILPSSFLPSFLSLPEGNFVSVHGLYVHVKTGIPERRAQYAGVCKGV